MANGSGTTRASASGNQRGLNAPAPKYATDGIKRVLNAHSSQIDEVEYGYFLTIDNVSDKDDKQLLKNNWRLINNGVALDNGEIGLYYFKPKKNR